MTYYNRNNYSFFRALSIVWVFLIKYSGLTISVRAEHQWELNSDNAITF